MKISSAQEDGYTISETDSVHIDSQIEETEDNQPSSINLKTKLVVALERCLGPSLCIQQLDQLQQNKSKL